MLKRLALIGLMFLPMAPASKDEHRKVSGDWWKTGQLLSSECEPDITINFGVCSASGGNRHSVVIHWSHTEESNQGYIQVWSQVGSNWLQIDTLGLKGECQETEILSSYVLAIPGEDTTHTIHIEMWLGGMMGPYLLASDSKTFHP